jgi:DegV family protein with EDD domain
VTRVGAPRGLRSGGGRATIGYGARMARVPRTVVVTDSTACLPPGLAEEAGLAVVPLAAIVDGVPGLEGVDFTSADVSRALLTRHGPVTTSRPAPAELARRYADALAAGAEGVVSIHLSAELSGTYDAARLAAEEFGGRVSVVDSGSTAMGLGFVALAAAAAAAQGAGPDEVASAAAAAAGRTTTLFYVDTLEYLRRGGRIGAASALLGTALAVKPILDVRDGRIVVREKVRTTTRALARLVDLAVEAADGCPVDIAVHHFEATTRAEELAGQMAQRLGDLQHGSYLTEVGAVLAAHVGPGLVGIVVHRRA